VIDAHSGSFLGTGLVQGMYRRWLSVLGRRAQVVLIHNEDLIPYAEALGLTCLVLEMAVPENPTIEAAVLKRPAVVFVRGGGKDEPLAVMLAAARTLPDVNFYLTGACPAGVSFASNVHGTGFLAELDYWRLLNGCDAVVALTGREATVLSGAYEALAARKPLVLSQTETLARAFHKGAVLVENRPEAVTAGICQALSSVQELTRKGIELAERKARDWQRQFAVLQQLIVS
jgi:glycosyltransferase involved in cell wall biosynthesis